MRVAALVFVALVAAGARAQVAVVTTLPDGDPSQRDVAAGVAAAAAERWQTLSPPLAVDDTAACKTDVACLVTLARARAASHLLMVGVAGVGRRDHVVALQLLALEAGGARSLFEDTVVVAAQASPWSTGALVGARLMGVEGPAVRAVAPPPNLPFPSVSARDLPSSTGTGPSVWTLTGVGLIAGGAAVALATAAGAATGSGTASEAVVAVGGSAAVVLAVAGVACVLVDDG